MPHEVFKQILVLSGMEVVKNSTFYQDLAEQNPGVEIWFDEGFDVESCAYFWIVSKLEEGCVRNLAYVRERNGQLQMRTYDEAGDEKWVNAE